MCYRARFLVARACRSYFPTVQVLSIKYRVPLLELQTINQSVSDRQ